MACKQVEIIASGGQHYMTHRMDSTLTVSGLFLCFWAKADDRSVVMCDCVHRVNQEVSLILLSLLE